MGDVDLSGGAAGAAALVAKAREGGAAYLARADVLGALRKTLSDAKAASDAVDGALALINALAGAPAPAGAPAGAAGAFEAYTIPFIPLILERVLDKAASTKIAAVDTVKGAFTIFFCSLEARRAAGRVPALSGRENALVASSPPP